MSSVVPNGVTGHHDDVSSSHGGHPSRRQAVNLVNGSTLLGLWLARRRGVPVRPGPHGLWLVPGYPRRFPAPHAGAVCVGDVVLLRRGALGRQGVEVMDTQPWLLDHESRHATQWARWGGPIGFLPAYALACLWSWLRTGDMHSANGFEVAAGLADGGYRPAERRGLVGPALLLRRLRSRLGRRRRRGRAPGQAPG
jgi:hypothetical protein